MPGKVNPTQCEAVTMVCAQARMRADDRSRLAVLLPDDVAGKFGPVVCGGGSRLCEVLWLGLLFAATHESASLALLLLCAEQPYRAWFF